MKHKQERKRVQVFFFLQHFQLRALHPSIFHRRRCWWAGAAASVCHCWVLLFAQAVCGWGFIYGETPRRGHHSNIWTFGAHMSPWEQRQSKSIEPDSISLWNTHMHLEVDSHSNDEKISAHPPSIYLYFCSVGPSDYRKSEYLCIYSCENKEQKSCRESCLWVLIVISHSIKSLITEQSALTFWLACSHFRTSLLWLR